MPVCFYCNAECHEPWEYQMDHFPIPKRAGGTQVVVACAKCHHWKDRARDKDLIAKFDEHFSACPEHVVHLHELFLGSAQDGNPEVARRTLLRIWPALPVELRWVNARLLAQLYETAAG